MGEGYAGKVRARGRTKVSRVSLYEKGAAQSAREVETIVRETKSGGHKRPGERRRGEACRCAGSGSRARTSVTEEGRAKAQKLSGRRAGQRTNRKARGGHKRGGSGMQPGFKHEGGTGSSAGERSLNAKRPQARHSGQRGGGRNRECVPGSTWEKKGG